MIIITDTKNSLNCIKYTLVNSIFSGVVLWAAKIVFGCI